MYCILSQKPQLFCWSQRDLGYGFQFTANYLPPFAATPVHGWKQTVRDILKEKDTNHVKRHYWAVFVFISTKTSNNYVTGITCIHMQTLPLKFIWKILTGLWFHSEDILMLKVLCLFWFLGQSCKYFQNTGFNIWSYTIIFYR